MHSETGTGFQASSVKTSLARNGGEPKYNDQNFSLSSDQEKLQQSKSEEKNCQSSTCDLYEQTQCWADL